eukprot:733209-Rhodomonas_salina.6
MDSLAVNFRALLHAEVMPAISLCACYAMSGTGLAAIDAWCALRPAMCLRSCYAMSGTEPASRYEAQASLEAVPTLGVQY